MLARSACTTLRQVRQCLDDLQRRAEQLKGGTREQRAELRSIKREIAAVRAELAA